MKRKERSLVKMHILLATMVLCVIMVPVIAYLSGEWYPYWGHALLAIAFGVLAVLIKTHYFWEED
jgi:hypothetical protein